MAGVFHRTYKNSPGTWIAIFNIWIADNSPELGHWKKSQRSTGIPGNLPRAKALDVARAMEKAAAELAPANRPQVTTAFFQRQLRDLWEAAGLKAPIIDISFDQASADFLATIPDLTDTSAMSYRSFQKNFSKFLDRRSKDPLRSITIEDVQRFADTYAVGRSPRTVKNNIRFISSVWQHSIARGMADDDPTAALRLSNRRVTQKRAFSPEELKTLFNHIQERIRNPESPEDAARSEQWLFVCLAAIHNGFRLGDASHLKDSDFIRSKTANDSERIVIRISPEKKAFDHSTGEERDKLDFPCVGELRKLFLTLSPDPDSGRITPLIPTGSQASKQFKAIIEASGLATNKKGAKGGRQYNDLTFHSFRRSSATNMEAAGVDESIARRINDHDDPKVAQSYRDTPIHILEAAIVASAPKLL